MPYKDPEAQRAFQREWMHKRRMEYFEGKTCANCGSTENLELDHIDPEEKEDHRIWSWSADRRAAELEKCQPLCQVCHAEKSMGEHCTAGHGNAMYRNGCRCEVCRSEHNARSRAYKRQKKLERQATPVYSLEYATT